MSDRAVIGVVRATVVVGSLLAMIGLGLFVATGNAGFLLEGYGPYVLHAVVFAVVVWLVIPEQPRNALVWTLAASAAPGGLSIAGVASALLLVGEDPSQVAMLADVETLVPADLSSSAAWVLTFTGWGAFMAPFWMIFGLLLFPDGRLPSRRWRWLALYVVVAGAIGTVGSVSRFWPGSTVPAAEDPLYTAGLLASFLSLPLLLVAVANRLRRSSGATRQQFKWVLWGASVFAATLGVEAALLGTRYSDVMTVPNMAAVVVVVGSYGIAIGRYRLFDIDVVISRTVVIAGLAGFITAVYAAVVGGVGLLLGAGTEADLPLSIAATVVVAIAFQPVRDRMRRWADRLVYGERATPYEVLSRFASRMRDAVAAEDVIPQMAQLLARGTGASQAIVWMKTDDELRPIVSWPDGQPLPAPVASNDVEPSISGADHLAPVEHDGELLGAVTVTMPRGEAMTSSAEQLVDDVASQAGLVLRNSRLTADLIDTIQQLRSSRQRLVAAQDEERRRLERNLHDGAQQQLVALKIRLGMLRMVDDADKRASLVDSLLGETDDAIDSLRDLARGIYPPTLAQEGLVSALRAQAAKAAVPTRVEASEVGRYSADVEAAVYFCTLEALQNIAKYAGASEAWVRLAAANGSLRFEVTDNGRGFETLTTKRGAGLQNMEDRLEALGGSVEIASTPGRGTTIAGAVPVAAQAPLPPS